MAMMLLLCCAVILSCMMLTQIGFGITIGIAISYLGIFALRKGELIAEGMDKV